MTDDEAGVWGSSEEEATVTVGERNITGVLFVDDDEEDGRIAGGCCVIEGGGPHGLL